MHHWASYHRHLHRRPPPHSCQPRKPAPPSAAWTWPARFCRFRHSRRRASTTRQTACRLVSWTLKDRYDRASRHQPDTMHPLLVPVAIMRVVLFMLMPLSVVPLPTSTKGDRDQLYDARIATPVLLSAQCVLFNWRDSLQKDRILELLGVMTRAASCVGREQENHTFGHLHIIFRDWVSRESHALSSTSSPPLLSLS